MMVKLRGGRGGENEERGRGGDLKWKGDSKQNSHKNLQDSSLLPLTCVGGGISARV